MALQQHAPSPPPPYAQDQIPTADAAPDQPRPPYRIPAREPSAASRHAASPSHFAHAKREYSAFRSSQAPNTSPYTLDVSSAAHPVPREASSPVDADGAMSVDDRSRRRDTSVSMDDPDDRMAAEALCGLGKADSIRSPSGYETPLQYFPIDIEHTRSGAANDDREPLLSLLTSSHPWLGGTINGSLNAYSSTKNNSPRFIRYGADFVERTIGSPMAHTVGSVGRRTGVEGSLRRYLGATRRPSELEGADADAPFEESASKRRRISADDEHDRMDVERDIRAADVPADIMRTLSGSSSVDTLPIYDENRSPPYEDPTLRHQRQHQQQQQQGVLSPSAANRSWSTQLMISTSGLGAALNDASLSSLKYCLTILRTANTRVRHLMEALRSALHEFDRDSPLALEEGGRAQSTALEKRQPPPSYSESGRADQGTLAERIAALNAEIWTTLKNVVTSVSRYTGGALPENASLVVRWQLMSVPQRWRRAITHSSAAAAAPPTSPAAAGDASTAGTGAGAGAGAAGSADTVSSAHRMLAFAIEGLDMMDQVGGVVDSTILSAERWLESMGRGKAPRADQQQPMDLEKEKAAGVGADAAGKSEKAEDKMDVLDAAEARADGAEGETEGDGERTPRSSGEKVPMDTSL